MGDVIECKEQVDGMYGILRFGWKYQQIYYQKNWGEVEYQGEPCIWEALPSYVHRGEKVSVIINFRFFSVILLI